MVLAVVVSAVVAFSRVERYLVSMNTPSTNITARRAITLMIVTAVAAAGGGPTELSCQRLAPIQSPRQLPPPSVHAGGEGSLGSAQLPAGRLVIRGQSPLERAKALLPNSERESKRLHGQLSLARLSERRGQTEQARHLYTQYQRKQSRNPVPYHRLGIIEAKAKRYTEAEQYLRKAASMGTPSATLLSDLGYLCYLQNRLEQAEEFLRRAVDLDPENTAANNNLGLVLGEQRRFAESLTAFRRAVSPGEAHSNLAFVLTQMGEHRQALEHYSAALNSGSGSNLRAAAQAMAQLAEKRPELASGELRDAAPATPRGEQQHISTSSAAAARRVSEPSEEGLEDEDDPLDEIAAPVAVRNRTRGDDLAKGPAAVDTNADASMTDRQHSRKEVSTRRRPSSLDTVAEQVEKSALARSKDKRRSAHRRRVSALPEEPQQTVSVAERSVRRTSQTGQTDERSATRPHHVVRHSAAPPTFVQQGMAKSSSAGQSLTQYDDRTLVSSRTDAQPAFVRRKSGRRAGSSTPASVVVHANYQLPDSISSTHVTPTGARMPNERAARPSADRGQATRGSTTRPPSSSPGTRVTRQHVAMAVELGKPGQETRIREAQVVFASPQPAVTGSTTDGRTRPSTATRSVATAKMISDPPPRRLANESRPAIATQQNRPAQPVRQRSAVTGGWTFVDQGDRRPLPTSPSASQRPAGTSLRIVDHGSQSTAD